MLLTYAQDMNLSLGHCGVQQELSYQFISVI